MLNFSYILFNTARWDINHTTHPVLFENIFLLTTLKLMKHAFEKKLSAIEKIFDLWREYGFIDINKNEDSAILIFFLIYISETKEFEDKELAELLARANNEFSIHRKNAVPTSLKK